MAWMKPLLVAIFVLPSLHIAGCATPKSHGGKWLSYEQVNPSLRRKIGMEPGDYVKACGRFSNVGQFRTAKDLQPRKPGEYEEIILADGPANFYDRKTGQLVAECGYWSCTRHPRFCSRHCPPREWTCDWEMP